VSNVSVYRVGEDYLNEEVLWTFAKKRKDKKGVSHEFKFIVTIDKDDNAYLSCEVDGEKDTGSLCFCHDWSRKKNEISIRYKLADRVEERIQACINSFNIPYPHKRVFKYLCLHFRTYHEEVEIVKSEEHYHELFKYYYTNKKLYEDVLIEAVDIKDVDTRPDHEKIIGFR
tara:strand:+ start:175 stop:687 length:513 start_codon:yes stop_codon:yes gene_type:complete